MGIRCFVCAESIYFYILTCWLPASGLCCSLLMLNSILLPDFPVVGTNMRKIRLKSVQEANCVNLGYALWYLFWGEPLHGRRLGGWELDSSSWFAAEYQGNNPAIHVLINARELFHLDVDAGLLQDLADNTLLRSLVQLQDSARWLPVAVVPALDHQHPPVLADDGSRHGHGVQRR